MTDSKPATETAFLDRIDVVNGSSSVMYGQSMTGGMIGLSLNLVSLRRLTSLGLVTLDKAEPMILDSRNYAAELAAAALTALWGTDQPRRPVGQSWSQAFAGVLDKSV